MTWSSKSKWSRTLTLALLQVVVFCSGCTNSPSLKERIQNDLKDYEASARSCPAASIQSIVFENVTSALRIVEAVPERPLLRIASAIVIEEPNCIRLVIHFVQYPDHVTEIQINDSVTGDVFRIPLLPEDSQSNAMAEKRGVVFVVSRKWLSDETPTIFASKRFLAVLDTDVGTQSQAYPVAIYSVEDKGAHTNEGHVAVGESEVITGE